MRALAKSMIRFSWATGLLGASQLTGLLKSSRRPPANLGGGRSRRSGLTGVDGLDAVTWTTQGYLGEALQAAFQAGDDLQGEWMELFADTLSPRRWARAASLLAARSVDTLRITSPGSAGSVARQELRNKLEVYWLVKGARKLVDLPPRGETFLLWPYVTRAYELDSYQALWVIEGLAHDYAEGALRQSGSPSDLLRGEAVAGLPESSLPMLHGGLGLAFAEHMLGALTPRSTAAEARQALDRFVALCRTNSMERYADSAIESLGLDARCFFPDLVPVVEKGLRALGDEQLHRFFWHGVGRAIYFLPINFIPGYGSLRHAVQMARQESPHEMARDHTLAGVSYAFTMVNMSHPEILEALLREHGEELRDTTFADGVVASILMRQEITPGAPVLRSFIDHRPAGGVRRLWEDMVRRPCQRALDAGDADDSNTTEVAEVYRSLPRRGAVE
ncbi:MAG: hypothetical protein GY719_36415 [bacterium]|nr:hypothetical protein [bacterium]